jgi:hypothetical protein
MSDTTIAIRTEVYGLELHLSAAQLAVMSRGEPLTSPIVLRAEDAERLRLQMAKAQLLEWNHIESLKANAEGRRRRYLASWLVLCLGAFSAYIGYPSYYVPLFLTALSIFLWWRAGYEEQRQEKDAQAQRNQFVADWSYFQQRAEEPDAT